MSHTLSYRNVFILLCLYYYKIITSKVIYSYYYKLGLYEISYKTGTIAA